MSGMRAIGFWRRIQTLDRVATGPAALLHTKKHGHVPGAVQRAAGVPQKNPTVRLPGRPHRHPTDTTAFRGTPRHS
jgi:hypothetical protein